MDHYNRSMIHIPAGDVIVVLTSSERNQRPRLVTLAQPEELLP